MIRTGTAANVPLRGVGAQAPKLRKNFRIAEGRHFTPGTFEVIVGRGATEQFAGLTVGNRVRWGTTEWNVVGIFEDGGSVAESEVWTDASVLQGVYYRGSSYQSMRVRLTSAAAARTFQDTITTTATQGRSHEKNTSAAVQILRRWCARSASHRMLWVGAICARSHLYSRWLRHARDRNAVLGLFIASVVSC